MEKHLILKPRMSEKAYNSSSALNTYVFDVPSFANKLTIASAVEAQFGVKVDDVKTTIIKGKVKKSYQKRNQPIKGKRSDCKKAYVRLHEGNSINLFGDEEASKKTANKKAKAVKKESK